MSDDRATFDRDQAAAVQWIQDVLHEKYWPNAAALVAHLFADASRWRGRCEGLEEAIGLLRDRPGRIEGLWVAAVEGTGGDHDG